MWPLATELFDKGRDDFVNVTNQTVIGVVEDRGFFIFIDGDDDLRAVPADVRAPSSFHLRQ